METLKNYMRRNAPVFVLGLTILTLFVTIILADRTKDYSPAGFKRVEETIFEEGEATKPEEVESPALYASQIPSPDNKGKRYFYGEYDPDLRDEEGYPIPPKPETLSLPLNMDTEIAGQLRRLAQEEYYSRLETVRINFTDQGFVPSDALAWTGGKVVWTNITNTAIRFVQALPVHDALKNGIDLKPGESFEFRPLKSKQITYMEINSQKYGSLFVSDSTVPLIKNLPDQ